ncbi:MerR family transcriptional regulator [uncultured Gemella sp.]|uniref:MerR family transcriptional regulator n=1 Tax=uncultured Gemella sp. TaxID=254352 RepID=UPI0028D0069C|nr:MerR family transcriptional regulator [uncultured Gemella sp.]
MRINEVAKLTGVSVRTLQYYDEIGLLIPEKLNNGYRDYSDENLDKLQKILFYRFLKFKLNDIKELLDGDIDSLTILEQQRELILKEKEKFEIILYNIEKTIKTYKGEETMTIEEKFNGFKKEDLNKYEDQAIEKYGKETIEESKKRQSGKENIVTEKFNSVFRSMAEYRKNEINIEEKEVQSKVEELYNYMNKYAFDCSVEVFSYIGKGYSQNLEFKNNIDKFGEGVAEYTSKAIEVYCNSRLNR